MASVTSAFRLVDEPAHAWLQPVPGADMISGRCVSRTETALESGAAGPAAKEKERRPAAQKTEGRPAA